MDLHPFCKIFPPMAEEAFKELVADIKLRGQLAPIIAYEGQILDGRHRWQACQELGLEPYIEAYEGDDPLGYVISLNLKRRHLDESQRAMIAGRLAEADARYKENLHGMSRPEAAAAMNVAVRSVASAKKVLAEGVDELIEAVDHGKVAVSVAAKIADMPDEDQRQVINSSRPEVEIKKVVREKREKDLADKTIAEAIKGNQQVYNLILADPPWRFQPYSENGMDRSADNHYPTMLWEDIAALKVPAAKNCLLFMWATSPMLPEAIAVMRQWGFEYKSHIVWVKQKPGTGYWTRSWHELLLIGTKGDVAAPAPGTQPPSVVQAPAGRHSEKPPIFAETIEKLYPNAIKLEMFCRSARDGWSVMGNEIEE